MDFYLIPVAEAQTIGSIVSAITGFLRSIIPILFLIATVVFLWGIILFITSGGDEEKRKEGRQYIIFGLIGLFVMVAVWGIVSVLVGFFGFGGIGAPSLPDLPGSGSIGGSGNNRGGNNSGPFGPASNCANSRDGVCEGDCSFGTDMDCLPNE